MNKDFKLADFTTIERVRHNGHIHVKISVGNNWLDLTYIGYSQREAVRKAWQDIPSIGVMWHSSGVYGYQILGFAYGIDDYIILRSANGKITINKVYHSEKSGEFIRSRGQRYYLANSVRNGL